MGIHNFHSSKQQSLTSKEAALHHRKVKARLGKILLRKSYSLNHHLQSRLHLQLKKYELLLHRGFFLATTGTLHAAMAGSPSESKILAHKVSSPSNLKTMVSPLEIFLERRKVFQTFSKNMVPWLENLTVTQIGP